MPCRKGEGALAGAAAQKMHQCILHRRAGVGMMPFWDKHLQQYMLASITLTRCTKGGWSPAQW